MTEISKEKMKTYMEEYKKNYGLGGLFDIIVEITEGKRIEQKDLEEHQNAIEKERQATVIEHEHLKQFNIPANSEPPITEASIYAEKHLSAVRQDLIEQSQIEKQALEDSPKEKVLELKKSAPNPWEDAEVVSPGQLKL